MNARLQPEVDAAARLERWQRSNAHYIAAALAVLRARLDAAAAGEGHAGPSTAELQRLADASASEPPPALLQLARTLGMSAFEHDVLLLCLAIELDTSIAARCAAAMRAADRDHPSFALALTLFENPAWEALSPERPLRWWRLIEINQPGARALTASALRADERIVNHVKGLDYIDDRIATLLSPMKVPQVEALPPSQQTQVAAISAAFARSSDDGAAVLVLRGRDRPSKRDLAAAAAASHGLRVVRLPADALPAQAADLETLARLWHRESLMLPVALYIDAHDVERSSAADSLAHRIGRFLARCGGWVFVDTRDGLDLPVEPVAELDIAKPTPAEQCQIWMAAIGHGAETLPQRLSAQFDLGASEINAITAAALADPPGPASLDERLWSACRARTRPVMARLAERLDARATWSQLVLPAPETALLQQIVAQVESRAVVYDRWGFRDRLNRGLGVSALFAGDSGTGKTMAAEVVANALKLDIYRIDLSSVVSKYIGETEKNLRAVFDAADGGGAILLFDEADALFGKRSEVKDAHDRYANIEIDYLLQRMESFSGLAILATNMKSALDSAFLRRLRFVVNFPYPGAAERKRIWERAFPASTPTDALDYDRLARLNITGGNIHSIALAGAFMAARAGTPVTMELLMEAGRVEMRKLEKPVNEADFRWLASSGARA